MEGSGRPVIEGEVLEALRRLAAWDRQLPPGPWRAVERSHLEHHGPAEFDPEVDVDRASFDANERKRSETSVWRGLVDADGVPLVGEPLAGGRPRQVADPAWRFLAEVRTTLPLLLDVCRQLWVAAEHQRQRPGGAAACPSPEPPPVDLELAGRACYAALGEPVAWEELPARVREQWRQRAAAVVEAAGTAGRGASL